MEKEQKQRRDEEVLCEAFDSDEVFALAEDFLREYRDAFLELAK